MFLKLTDEEEEAVNLMEALRQEQQAFVQQRLPSFNVPPEEREKASVAREAKIEEYRIESRRLEELVSYQRAFLKKELQKTLEKAGPFGETEVFMPVLGEIVATLLYGELAEGVGVLAKGIALRALEVLGNEEVMTARAKNTHTRWMTLKATGLPEELVNQLLVAEFARPLPTWTLPTSKK